MLRARTSHRVSLGRLLAVALLFVGATALPAQELTSLGGERLRPQDLESGTVIVVSWASWSPRCRDIVAQVNGLAERWGSRARVVTVNFQEDAATVRQFLDGAPIKAPVFLDLDGEFSKRRAVTHLPGLLILSGGQTAFNGRLPQQPDATIERALGGGKRR